MPLLGGIDVVGDGVEFDPNSTIAERRALAFRFGELKDTVDDLGSSIGGRSGRPTADDELLVQVAADRGLEVDAFDGSNSGSD